MSVFPPAPALPHPLEIFDDTSAHDLPIWRFKGFLNDYLSFSKIISCFSLILNKILHNTCSYKLVFIVPDLLQEKSVLSSFEVY